MCWFIAVSNGSMLRSRHHPTSFRLRLRRPLLKYWIRQTQSFMSNYRGKEKWHNWTLVLYRLDFREGSFFRKENTHVEIEMMSQGGLFIQAKPLLKSENPAKPLTTESLGAGLNPFAAPKYWPRQCPPELTLLPLVLCQVPLNCIKNGQSHLAHFFSLV